MGNGQHREGCRSGPDVTQSKLKGERHQLSGIAWLEGIDLVKRTAGR